jgi:hypothetical protein
VTELIEFNSDPHCRQGLNFAPSLRGEDNGKLSNAGESQAAVYGRAQCCCASDPDNGQAETTANPFFHQHFVFGFSRAIGVKIESNSGQT